MEQNANERNPADAPYTEADMWDDIRAAYEDGDTSRILAERHGVGERTVRRRAAAEEWVRRAPRGFVLGDPHGPMGALDFCVKQRREETDDLLLAPSPEGLLAYAFRRATEAAALGRPAEAGGWLRLVDQVRRNLDVMGRLADEPDESVVRRAVLGEALAGHWKDRLTPGEDVAEMAAVAGGRAATVPAND